MTNRSTIEVTTLRGLRESARLTQSAVAEAVGVQTRVVSEYENGHREPRLATLKALATVYRVDLLMVFAAMVATSRSKEATDGSRREADGG